MLIMTLVSNTKSFLLTKIGIKVFHYKSNIIPNTYQRGTWVSKLPPDSNPSDFLEKPIPTRATFFSTPKQPDKMLFRIRSKHLYSLYSDFIMRKRFSAWGKSGSICRPDSDKFFGRPKPSKLEPNRVFFEIGLPCPSLIHTYIIARLY